MEDVSRRRREAIRGVFTEVVNDMNTELRNPLIDKSGIYAKFDRLEALYLELVVLNEQYQEILLAKAEATDDEIDKEFEECEVYIMERYYLKARIREMREQDRDAQAKTSQIPPGASSASPNSETNNQKVIKLQTTSTSLSKSPEESMKNEIEGVEKEDSVKTARATEVKPAQAKARMLKEACSAPSIIDIEYEGKRGAMSAIKEKELNVAVKCNKVKDSETAVDSYVGVREAEAKNKAKPDKANLKGDGVNDSEAKPKGEGVKESEVNSKDGDKGDQVKESEGQKAGDEGDGKKDSEDEPKGDGVKDFEDEPKGDGVNDSEARPTGDTESKIKNRGDISRQTVFPGLTKDEIAAQCVLFFMAGYETTASTLSHCVYMLALNPECQDRLAAEVDSALSAEDVTLDYDTVKTLPYLDAVISETLRLLPPATRSVDFLMNKSILAPEQIFLIVCHPQYFIHFVISPAHFEYLPHNLIY
ncbi:TBXAS1 [Cordylochernes scorpioides]|uniref:TBXAS1 n=1 Tax=Cordylochernes scorpioides TaxID=51811 RepID=A0ABY6LSR0_9ARAC|nr:TBXAS1 [Cordylochernes scorpioides]